MTQVAKTGAPEWARLMWYDSTHIYMEMPVKDNRPIILKFSATEGGLTTALKTMKDVWEKAGPHRQKNGWNLDHDIIKRPLNKPQLDAKAKRVVRDVLKKMGIL